MISLSEIKPRDIIQGIVSDSLVEIIDVKFHGDDVLQVTYREYEKPETRPDDALLYKDDEPRLEKITPEKSVKFDADGKNFRLVSEAYRIHSDDNLGKGKIQTWDSIQEKFLSEKIGISSSLFKIKIKNYQIKNKFEMQKMDGRNKSKIFLKALVL